MNAPQIGTYWLGQGGIYIGIAAADGDLSQGHLVLCEADTVDLFRWRDAIVWARDQTVDGHTDFRLPTLFEAALISANARQQIIKQPWLWTCTGANTEPWLQNFTGSNTENFITAGTSPSYSYAWLLEVDSGGQYRDSVYDRNSVRAVRRFVL